MSDSMLSLIPPLLAIFLAIWTKRIIVSLLVACWLGTTLLQGGNVFLGFLDLIEKHILVAIADKGNATILLYGASFGGLMVILQKTGGILAIGDFFARTIKSSRLAELGAWFLGIFVFIDDYFSCLTTGNIMRPIFDRYKICREKLAFIVDATAAPVCLLVPISTWVVYVTGLITAELNRNATQGNSFVIYLSTIPMNFYALMAVFGTGLLILGKFSFGTMHKAERRCEQSGKLWRDGAILPSEHDFSEFAPNQNIQPKLIQIIVPFIVLFVVAIFMFLYTGNYWKETHYRIVDAIRHARSGISILVAVLAATGSALLLGRLQNYFSLAEGSKYFTSGMKAMYTTIIILVMAWTMSSLTKELGTAKYVGSLISNTISPIFIPLILFIFGCCISFTTGTSYGTFAILTPLAIPLCLQVNIPIEYGMAAVLSGGIFGDHSSPVSDTTILSSSSSCCDVMDHTKTQLPYSIWFAFSASIAFIVLPQYGLMWSLLACIMTSSVSLAVLIRWKPQ